ncbi:KTSC domain-containing protein [Kaistella palustris]|uniref:KTSC domain-containing protein n=1 Tax=Kaistella palustris TaxID=493376 RepID=UPI000428BA63|nr:KTSC domain-containing protein [Kaistella palustris]
MPSTVIKKYSYEPEREILRIIYQSGAVYDYYNVPLEVFEAFRTAFSKGVFLNQKIKPFYSFEKKSL